jgi:hypothetical protein
VSEIEPMADLMIMELHRALELARDRPMSVKNALSIGAALQSALERLSRVIDGSALGLRLWQAVYEATAIAIEARLILPPVSDEEAVAARDMCPRTLLALADELDGDAVAHEGDSVHDLPSWMRAVGRRYRRRAKLAHGGWAAMRANEAQKRGQAG